MPKTPADLRSLARSYTEMGVRVLAGIANSEEHPASARVAAVTALFDRGWGRPDQQHTGDDGNRSIQIVIRQLVDVVGVGKEEPPLLEHEPLEK
jgi:hypothetical protein